MGLKSIEQQGFLEANAFKGGERSTHHGNADICTRRNRVNSLFIYRRFCSFLGFAMNKKKSVEQEGVSQGQFVQGDSPIKY